jgi:hypothetical protein
MVLLRQGPWIEDGQTPPGQECSNGSLIFFAAVSWRAFFCTRMKLLTVKTVRFAQVVEKAGAPEVYTLWQKPAQDRHLQSLIKNHRLMTVQKSDGGAEFGFVGFKERKGASYLEFPKSLKRFENKRIIGIKWDLVKSS